MLPGRGGLLLLLLLLSSILSSKPCPIQMSCVNPWICCEADRANIIKSTCYCAKSPPDMQQQKTPTTHLGTRSEDTCGYSKTHSSRTIVQCTLSASISGMEGMCQLADGNMASKQPYRMCTFGILLLPNIFHACLRMFKAGAQAMIAAGQREELRPWIHA